MEQGDDSAPTPSSSMERPVFPQGPAREPKHELHDRARAAKLRHKAAKARLKANRLEARSKVLNEKASHWERRADELDGIVRGSGDTAFNV